MTYSEAQKRATIAYKKKNVHRIPLDVKNEVYDEIKAAADQAGQTVAAYAKQAIFERMERESNTDQPE